MSDELMLFQHPGLPDKWTYEESVKRMKGLIYKWRNLTRDVANELWIAREKLRVPREEAAVKNHDANASRFTWSGYCEEIGLNYTTANRWLNSWFPESLTLENKPTVTKKSYEKWLPEQEDCDLLLTDPPYSTDIENIDEFVTSWLPIAIEKVKPTGRAYVCIGAYPQEIEAYLHAAKDLPLRLANILVWTYQNTLGPSPTHTYKLNWQAILYFLGPDAPPLKSPQMIEQFTVMNIPAPDGRQGDRYHQWQKPLELAERLIKHSTEEGSLILDPFSGTGTFVLAANRINRVGRGCDIDPVALDISVKRGCVCEQLEK